MRQRIFAGAAAGGAFPVSAAAQQPKRQYQHHTGSQNTAKNEQVIAGQQRLDHIGFGWFNRQIHRCINAAPDEPQSVFNFHIQNMARIRLIIAQIPLEGVKGFLRVFSRQFAIHKQPRSL